MIFRSLLVVRFRLLRLVSGWKILLGRFAIWFCDRFRSCRFGRLVKLFTSSVVMSFSKTYRFVVSGGTLRGIVVFRRVV